MSADLRPAHAVYTASLEKRRGGALLQSGRMGLWFLSESTGGLVPAPSLSDVVVRSRSGPGEVTRIPAGDPAGAGDLLQRVQDDLQASDQRDFDVQWGIAPESSSR